MDQTLNWVADNYNRILEILVGLIVIARLTVSLTPSKADDEIVNSFERVVRWLLDAVAGSGHRNLIQKADPSSTPAPATAHDNSDPLEQFQAILEQFGATLKIVPKSDS